MPLEAKIEALLFLYGDPLSISSISRLLQINEEDATVALDNLKHSLQGRGICLIDSGDEVVLATRPEMAELAAHIREDSLSSTLGRAALEALAMILYNAPTAKSDIDFVRGVDSRTVLRTLMVRGLVQRDENHLYSPTIEALQFLGISEKNELPEYEEFFRELRDINSSRLEIEGN